MLTQEILKEMLHYDPSNGVFTWKENHRQKGKVAGWYKEGYKGITINGKDYPLHRVVWLYVHGKLPDGEIDHINGIRHDNRIENLRDVSHSTNMKNAKINKLNTSGHANISICKNCVVARIVAKNGKKTAKKFMVFSTKERALENAIKWRDEQYKIHNYHENHGRAQ